MTSSKWQISTRWYQSRRFSRSSRLFDIIFRLCSTHPQPWRTLFLLWLLVVWRLLQWIGTV